MTRPVGYDIEKTSYLQIKYDTNCFDTNLSSRLQYLTFIEVTNSNMFYVIDSTLIAWGLYIRSMQVSLSDLGKVLQSNHEQVICNAYVPWQKARPSINNILEIGRSPNCLSIIYMA